MSTQRREEIRFIAECPNDRHWAEEMRKAVGELFDWIDQLEAKAAERVIADGAKGPTPDYTGEGSAWIPPKTKPHTFAQMVNEVRDLAFDFGTSEQFRCRVADLLGKYINVEHGSKGEPEQTEAPALVVPEPTGRDLQEMAAEMRVDGDLVDFLAGASKVVLWYRSKIRAIPADRVLGDGMVAVDRAELEALQELLAQARCAAHAVEDNGECDMTGICSAVFACDSIRANQGGAAT